jgi:hypothetical protein
MPIDRADLVIACRTAYALAGSPEVARAWDDESACDGMTVGGLTHHLLAQVHHVSRLLAPPPGADAPIPLLDHYSRAAWVTAGAGDEANTSIRDDGNAAGAAGPDAVLAQVEPLLDRLPGVLAAPRDPDTIAIPWQGWSLTTDDFLATRSMELVVHADDLAASVGLPTPEFPASVVEVVVHLLAGVALRRHGQTPLVRALSRPQRAPRSVSAF